MDKLILTILNMSVTASFVILAVCVVRVLLKKAPKVISYALWAVVAFRLAIPFSFESVFSLMPINPNPIPQDIVYQVAPRIDTGFYIFDNAINASLPAPIQDNVLSSINPLQIWLAIGEFVWLIVIAIMVIYSIVTICLLKRRLKNAVLIKDNIYEADNLKTPFVLGYFNPKIYIPADLKPEEKNYIILHEQTHIKRKDHSIKLFAYLLLCIHWFNPFAWLAFVLMGADMELSCDERVLKELGSGIKKDYSASLLALSTGKRIINGSPLAFGEDGVKTRIKNILNFKKPSRIIVIVAVLLAAAIGIGLVANRMSSDEHGNANPIIMPNLMGLSYTEAKETLNELGLTDIIVEKEDGSSPEIISEEEWVIVSHDPAPGTQITKTTRIILVVTNISGSGETVPLADVERIQAGMTVDAVHEMLGEPHAQLHGMWGDVYYVDNGHQAIIYYDSNGKVQEVRFTMSNDWYGNADGKVMSVDDLRALAAKGDGLQFEDFAEYRCLNVSSNLDSYLNLYQIEAPYRLIVGADSNGQLTRVTLEGVWEDGGTGIDIRYDDLETFIIDRPIHMYLKEGTLSPTGATFVLNNLTNNEYTFGDPYTLQRKTNGGWEDIEIIIENYGFDSIGHMLPAKENKEVFVDWEWLYGELSPGDYRIYKDALFVRSPGDYDTFPLYTAFTISD